MPLFARRGSKNKVNLDQLMAKDFIIEILTWLLLLLPLSPLLKSEYLLVSNTRSALQIFEEKMILVKEDICDK